MGFNYNCGCRLSGNEFYLCDDHKQLMFNYLEITDNLNDLDNLELRKKIELLGQIKDTKRVNYNIYYSLKIGEDKVKDSIREENRKIHLR